MRRTGWNWLLKIYAKEGECLRRCWNIILQGAGWGCSWMCGENVCGGVAVFVPIIDHIPPVRGSLIFEVCHIYPGKGSFTSFATYWANLLILPYWDIRKATHSLDLCNSRIIHVSLNASWSASASCCSVGKATGPQCSRSSQTQHPSTGEQILL